MTDIRVTTYAIATEKTSKHAIITTTPVTLLVEVESDCPLNDKYCQGHQPPNKNTLPRAYNSTENPVRKRGLEEWRSLCDDRQDRQVE